MLDDNEGLTFSILPLSSFDNAGNSHLKIPYFAVCLPVYIINGSLGVVSNIFRQHKC